MRTVCFAGMLLIALSVLAQDSKPAIFVSHNRIDGPFGGQYRVEDLEVFSSGRVLYVEEGTTTLGQQPSHASHEAQIEANEMQQLVKFLNGPAVRSLPKKIPSKTKPIDFFWQASFEINRPDGAQRVRVENFYPFLNLRGHAYPQALIDLECASQDIQAKAAKRQQPADEDNWCKNLATTRGR
jgi:hypothetical protein